MKSGSAKAKKTPPMDDPQIDSVKFLPNYLPYLLGHASFVINKDFNQYVQDTGISPLEWRVLATLCDEDALTIGELVHIVVAQQPTLTKAVKRLEEIGLVRRVSDASDRRKTVARVTEQGRALCASLVESALQHEQFWLRRFSKQEVDTVLRVLHSIIKQGQSSLPFLDPV